MFFISDDTTDGERTKLQQLFLCIQWNPSMRTPLNRRPFPTPLTSQDTFFHPNYHCYMGNEDTLLYYNEKSFLLERLIYTHTHSHSSTGIRLRLLQSDIPTSEDFQSVTVCHLILGGTPQRDIQLEFAQTGGSANGEYQSDSYL